MLLQYDDFLKVRLKQINRSAISFSFFGNKKYSTKWIIVKFLNLKSLGTLPI